jgi:hypothetical protein
MVGINAWNFELIFEASLLTQWIFKLVFVLPGYKNLSPNTFLNLQ